MSTSSLLISLTGLQGIDTALQAVSDNLANSGTTGFKAETAQFETLLGTLVGGDVQGGGVVVSGISRDFSQGPIVRSNSPTDIAIQGNGFFVLQDQAGRITYSRNGRMVIGSDGTLLGSNGGELQGFALNASGTASGVLGSIKIPLGVLAPTASTAIKLSGNLDAGDPVLTGPIDPTDSSTFSSSVSVQVFDSLGNSHVLTFFFQNAGPTGATPPTNQFNFLATFDGSTTGLTNNTGSFEFDTAGNLVSGGIPAMALTATPAGANPLSLNLDFTALTEFAAATAAGATADGNSVGTPQTIQIDDKGTVSIAFSNGQVSRVAQVAVATFNSPQGLELGSSGAFQETVASGTPIIGTAGAGSAGIIRPSSLESSNVDTTSALIDLVVLQRSFQANAQALQTADNVLGTVVQLQTI